MSGQLQHLQIISPRLSIFVLVLPLLGLQSGPGNSIMSPDIEGVVVINNQAMASISPLTGRAINFLKIRQVAS